MITLHNASLQRGSKQLLTDANLIVYNGQKVGFIGANGSGKSSIFQLFLRQLQIDSGDCQLPANWRVSHMAQEISTSHRSALDYVLDGDQALRQLQQAVEKQTTDKHSFDGQSLAKLYVEMESIDGYSAPSRAQQLLTGLGFAAGTESRPVSDFSGGWRIRLNLAQSLMCPSDLLLLDEPTNHLDLDATLWLERWLQHYRGTLIIISHDRDFLDNVIDRIVSIEDKSLFSYKGNYSDFERQRAQRLAQQQAAFKKQQQRIADIESFVRRFRAKASKARQAQSRLKELDRMATIAPAHVDSLFDFSIPVAQKIPDPLLTIADATVGYGGSGRHNTGKPAVLTDVNLSILADTRIGLLGPNGAGKSTLLKTLANQLPLLSGERVTPEHLAVGYFAQHQLEALDLEASPALHIQRLSPTASEQSIRTYLGGFNFRGDRVLEAIRHFSGGEKARLALALLAWQKPNLLLLDEPTNHLDLEMRHALTVALQKFSGAIVLISHDRHLLRNTVDEFLLVNNGVLSQFAGDLNDYQGWLTSGEKGATAAAISPSESNNKTDKRGQRQTAAAKRVKLTPLMRQLRKLERQIEDLGKQLADTERQLADTSLYTGESESLQGLLEQQGRLRQQMVAAEERWLTTSEQLDRQQAGP